MSAASRRHFRVPLPDGRVLELGPRTLVMGILNITPDSFADGGARLDPGVAVADGLRMIEDGADLLDVGGESTRPGAPPLDAAEEWRRVAPVLEALVPRATVPVSIDTYKAEIAARALDLGAVIVNDVSGLTYDPPLANVVASRRAAVVLMHNRGRSADMYARAVYEPGHVVETIARELGERVDAARAAGIDDERIILDPGIGFAKRAAHSFETIAGLAGLASLGRPLLAGPSRKSFLKLAIGDVPASDRVWATAAAVTASVLAGAHIVRVHDVREMVQVARVADATRARAQGQRAEGKGQREETGQSS
jgi:dihydropteroate synthase